MRLKHFTPYAFLAGITVILGVVGWLSFVQLRNNAINDLHEEIRSIGELKTSQLANWLSERRGDASTNTRNSLDLEALSQWMQSGEKEVRLNPLKRHFDDLMAAYGYTSVTIYDNTGKVRLTRGERHLKPYPEEAMRAIAARTTVLVDFHRQAETGQIRLGFITPLLIDGRGEGAVGFEIDPQGFLYPYLQKWPSPSKTAETLLVEKNGDHLLYLNELRHQHNSALKLQIPLSRTSIAGVKAATGARGIIHAQDYRGREVIAYASAIPGTPWLMVTKIDRAEALTPLHKIGLVSGAIGMLLFALSAGLGWMMWNNYRHQAERSYRQLFELSPLPMWIYDPVTLQLLEINKAAADNYGYTRDEFLGMTLKDICPEEDVPNLLPVTSDMNCGIAKGDWRHRKKDGSLIHASVTSQPVEMQDGREVRVATAQDISERLQSEMVFRALFEQANVGVARIDSKTGQFLLVNQKYAQLLGYTSQEMLDMNFMQITHPDDLHEAMDSLAKLGNGECPASTPEKRYIRKDGQVAWVELTVSPLWIAGELPHQHIAVVHDITLRRLLEEEIRESEYLYRSLASMVPVGIFRANASGDCIYINDNWSRITGQSMQDATGRGWMKTLHPDDRESVTWEWDRCVNLKKPFEMEFCYLDRNGKAIAVLCRAIAETSNNGEIIGFVGTITDLTEKRASEKLIRQWADVFTHCTLGLALGDPVSNTIRVCNPALAKMLDKSAEDIIDHPVLNLYAPAEHHKIRKWLVEADTSGHAHYETWMVKKGGDLIPAQIDLVNIKDEQGNPLYRVASYQDISNRKEAEQVLIRVQKSSLNNLNRALEAERRIAKVEDQARNAIAQELHDDLGQHLTGIAFIADHLAHQLGTQNLQQANEASRITALIKSAIDKTRRMARDLYPSDFHDGNLKEGISRVLLELESAFPVKCELQCNKNLPQLPATNSRHLFRIIQEAVNNAVRHGGATAITVNARAAASHTTLEITDNGTGFDPDAPSSNHGLGLKIMQDRAAIIGATLSIDQPARRGTRIIVKIAAGRSNKELSMP